MNDPAPELRADIERFTQDFQRMREEIGRVIAGQHEIVDGVLLALIAGGHVLLEGVPGLGKTLLVRTLADVLHAQFSRIQFTPDLMPADLIGTNILIETPEGGREFRFDHGPLFANIVLADEINRATPKTQSALLEAMQEHSVTVAGVTHQLDGVFFVLATQNPLEMEGTYPLPEAQLDRFLLKLLVKFPSTDEMETILDRTTESEAPAAEALFDPQRILEMSQLARRTATRARPSCGSSRPGRRLGGRARWCACPWRHSTTCGRTTSRRSCSGWSRCREGERSGGA